MFSIIPYLTAQFRLHPSMTAQDIAKLCYQASHGAEHLLSDPERARLYLLREIEDTEADGSLPLIEPISDGIARVNLAPWKASGLSADLLFELFFATARVSGDGAAALESYLNEVSDYLNRYSASVTYAEWAEFLTWYNGQGRPAIHHSSAYREAEKPAYRIVRRELLEGVVPV